MAVHAQTRATPAAAMRPPKVSAATAVEAFCSFCMLRFAERERPLAARARNGTAVSEPIG